MDSLRARSRKKGGRNKIAEDYTMSGGLISMGGKGDFGCNNNNYNNLDKTMVGRYDGGQDLAADIPPDDDDGGVLDCSQQDMEDLGVALLDGCRPHDTACYHDNCCNEDVSYSVGESVDYHPMIKNSFNNSRGMTDTNYHASKKLKLFKHDRCALQIRTNAMNQTKCADAFSRLSDEMVLCIFGMLDHATLGVVALVCHRFWRLSKDDSLWPRLDLGGRYLRPDVLGYVIQRGTRILRLASTKICSPVFRDTRPVLEDFVCRLEYLDLSECNMSEEDMELFLSKCRHLKKLSLESCELSLGVCSEVANNPNLVTLNLCLCGNLTAEGIDRILTNCKSLRALNVGWAHLSREAIDSLVKNLTDNIEQLNLSGSQNVINDRDLIQLMSRCHKLTELDVSDCLELTTAISSHIVRHLPKLRSISISRCFRINIQQFLSEVCRMRRLERVNAFRHIAADNVSSLEAATPNIRYNQEPFSTIARPTVGIRRTSIWQMRCRE